MVKKTKTLKYKKPPEAPRRFKSAYMFFSSTRHKEIREELRSEGVEEKTTAIAKLVSISWKELSSDDRKLWEDMARKDKDRYNVEKSLYTGPWKVLVERKGSKKDVDAPKRPMSAFLAYAHASRAGVKKENPKLSNAEISRALAQLWKHAPDEEKKDYIDQEFDLRQKYLHEIAAWRVKSKQELDDQRQEREDKAMKTVAARAEAALTNDGSYPLQNLQPRDSEPHTNEATSCRPSNSPNGSYNPTLYMHHPAGTFANYSQEYRHQRYSNFSQYVSAQYFDELPGTEGVLEGYEASDPNGYPVYCEHDKYYSSSPGRQPAHGFAAHREQYPRNDYGDYSDQNEAYESSYYSRGQHSATPPAQGEAGSTLYELAAAPHPSGEAGASSNEYIRPEGDEYGGGRRSL